MKKIIKFIIFINLLISINLAYAIPGPIIVGWVWLIWILTTFLSIGIWISIFYFKKLVLIIKKYKIVSSFLLSILIILILYYTYSSNLVYNRDVVIRFHNYLNKNSYDNISSSNLNKITSNIEVSNIRDSQDNLELDKEIRYSMEANRNILWSRYLVNWKITINDNIIQNTKDWVYSVNLNNFLNNLSSKNVEIIDLRTKEEYNTSIHFKWSKNYEYSKIINDEIKLDKNKKYYIICHDWMIDISRSLIVSIYLQDKWYQAFALETWMRPILFALDLKPIIFSKKFSYEKYTNQKWMNIIDVLWWMSDIEKYNIIKEGNIINDLFFYKYSSTILEQKIKEISSYKKPYFACYDNFSCFYSKIFIEKLKNTRNDLKLLIIR